MNCLFLLPSSEQLVICMSVLLPERKQENNTMEIITAANDCEVQVPRTAKLQTRHQDFALAKGAV